MDVDLECFALVLRSVRRSVGGWPTISKDRSSEWVQAALIRIVSHMCTPLGRAVSVGLIEDILLSSLFVSTHGNSVATDLKLPAANLYFSDHFFRVISLGGVGCGKRGRCQSPKREGILSFASSTYRRRQKIL